ncbi:MAG: c-type cytochrome biogenesis protein CcmI [Pseudomonadota bacterium]
MTVWLVFAVLTAIAAIAVLLPYARAQKRMGQGTLADDGGTDLEVYKDQLKEIERDLERGALSGEEAEAARLEVSRRLLKSADGADTPDTADQPRPSRIRRIAVLIVAFLIVPAGALGVYLSFGSPDLPDRPLAERVATSVENQDVAILIARVEDALRENPDDVRGWAILAPIYTRQGRFAEARTAFGELLRLNGESAALRTDFGEIIVIENQGLVTQEAMGQFRFALELDPTFPKARYYRALGLVQEGETDEARSLLIALRSDADANAPWLESVQMLLADMDAVASTQTGIAAPSPEGAAAISALSADQQAEAISGMAESLAARLETSPDDLEGWSNLIRAYVVLERRDDASASLTTALDVFADDSPARQRLLTIAEELQIERPDL